jgi:hypothetical protein
MFRLTNAGADAAGMSGPQRGAAPVLSGPCAPIPDVPALVRPDGLVIQSFQLKYRAIPARSRALALLLLLCAMPAGWAAEPAGATVVLQLPRSMSPDQVKGLIADLAAKGAHVRFRFGYSGAFQMPENVCESKPLRSQFPTHPSREFLRRSREFNRAIREGCGGIRDLALSVAIILVI